MSHENKSWHTEKAKRWGIVLNFHFLYPYHFYKNTLRERSLPKSMMKLRLKSRLMANLSSQAFFNGYPWKLNPLQPWGTKKPTPVHSSSFSSALWGQWFCPAQNHLGTHRHFFIIFKAFSVGPRAMQYHWSPMAFWTVHLLWVLCFDRGERKA